MIDTIVIKIHNLYKYDFVIETLNKAHKKEGKTYANIDIDDLGEEFTPKMLELTDHTSQYVATRYINKIYLPSSHYSMAYAIDTSKNAITFNFSIPKFLYGTNICQFIQHPNESLPFDRSNAENYEYNSKQTFDRLMKFLKKFISQFNTPVLSVGGNEIEVRKIDPEDVELERIDLCFNQFFLNKDEAIKYLMTQKQVRKKYIRDTANNKTDWYSSIYIRNDDYTAKIYHKGTEYRSKTGERKKHRVINKNALSKGLKEPFDIEFLDSQADRILRYEIEFKKAYMSKVYKNHVFRYNCNTHKEMKEIARKHRNLKDRNKNAHERLSEAKNKGLSSEKLASYEKKVIDTYRLLKAYNNNIFHFGVKFTDDYNYREYSYTYDKIAKIYNNMTGQSCEFRLDTREYFKNYAKQTIDLNIKKDENVSLYKTTPFTRKTFDQMIKVFSDFIDQFTLSEKISFTKIEKQIKEHNSLVAMLSKKGIRRANFESNVAMTGDGAKELKTIKTGSLKKVLALMDLYTLDELVNMKLIARSTKYEILRKLKVLNYDARNLTDVSIVTSNQFNYYLDMIFDNTDKFLLKNQYFK